MNKFLIFGLLFFLILGFFGTVKAEQNFVMKNYIFAKQDLENNITGGADYIKALDTFVDSKKNSRHELSEVLTRIDNTLSLLSNSRTHQQFRYIVLYLEQRILFELVNTPVFGDDAFFDAIEEQLEEVFESLLPSHSPSGSVKIDLNHPLSGKTLIFDVELVSLVKGNGNTQENIVQVGDFVSVHYTGSLEDGSIFDTSIERSQTLDFDAGFGQMIPGFDKGIIGMTVGEEKTLVLPPDEAYGFHDPDNYEIVPKSELQSFIDAGFALEVGEKLPTQFGELEILEVYE